jgi:DNA-binding transcriptional LysR family regulator
MLRIDIHQIKAFLAVADALQFKGAAERLHITQPALSRIVKALELEVGAQLLQRTTRVVELTGAGRVFAEQSRLALAHIERAAVLARRAQAGQIGNLRIAYMDFAINGALPEIIEAFSKNFPQIAIDLVHIPSTLQKDAIHDSSVDVGFMIGPFHADNIKTILFAKEKLVVLLPTEHRLAKRKAIRLRELAKEKFVLGGPDSWEAFRHHFFAISHAAGFLPDIAQEASTSDGIFGLVAANTGISIYPECVMNIQRSGLVIRPLVDQGVLLELVVCWKSAVTNPVICTFIDFLKTYLASEQHAV